MKFNILIIIYNFRREWIFEANTLCRIDYWFIGSIKRLQYFFINYLCYHLMNKYIIKANNFAKIGMEQYFKLHFSWRQMKTIKLKV